MATLRERSDKIIENVPVGILGITADGRLTLANRFFQERIAKDASGTAPSGTDLSQWASELRTHLDRALATGRNQILTDAVAGTQGRLSDFHIRVVPLSRPADDVEALALVEDLSELHSLQRQLVRAEKLVTVGVLSAGIAHEIGTPLAVIRVRAEHMLEQATDPRAADDLRAIVAQIDRISSTIRQVLEFSRQLPIEPGPADARGAVTQALELLDWRVSGKRLSVSVEAEESLPPVAAAADQLEQVVVNLLMNACDASANGGRIDVTLGRDAVREDCVRLAIADHGVGIPPENLNAVFDPYFTTKKHGEGTGLGLAIAAQIVRSHRGEISLKSTVGAGTVATVLWPVAERGAGA
jgi:signal transduction histidine kinase